MSELADDASSRQAARWTSDYKQLDQILQRNESSRLQELDMFLRMSAVTTLEGAMREHMLSGKAAAVHGNCAAALQTFLDKLGADAAPSVLSALLPIRSSTRTTRHDFLLRLSRVGVRDAVPQEAGSTGDYVIQPAYELAGVRHAILVAAARNELNKIGSRIHKYNGSIRGPLLQLRWGRTIFFLGRRALPAGRERWREDHRRPAGYVAFAT